MQHTVSFEMAKRLKDAGWTQDAGHWAWIVYHDGPCLDYTFLSLKERWPNNEVIAAPILTELLEALPKTGEFRIEERVNYCAVSMPVPGETDECGMTMFHSGMAHSVCDAAAELWLWCKEKGYVK